jgi:uncharacterized protein
MQLSGVLPRGLLALVAFCVASLIFVAPLEQTQAQAQQPRLNEPVVDTGQFLRLEDELRIGLALRELREKTGTQFGVLTLDNLGGEPIEAVSMRTAEQWRLGEQKTDRGLILVMSRAERRIRIEVGQGLEGVITDVQSRRIIDELMAPLMREGKADIAISAALVRLAELAEPQFPMVQRLEVSPRSERSDRESRDPPPFLLLLFFVIWMLVAKSGRGRRRRDAGWADAMLTAAILSSGRGGGGSFGGGGWSGGGGGFSGGGASGGW